MGVGRIFPGDSQKDLFPRGTNRGEISFYSLETKRTTFFAKTLIGKFHFSKSRRLWPPAPPDAHAVA